MGLPAHARKQRNWGETFALGRVCNASEAKWQAARRPEQWSLHVLLIPDPANKSAGYTATFILSLPCGYLSDIAKRLQGMQACDGLFVDYHWKEVSCTQAVDFLERRRAHGCEHGPEDAWFGVDVYGRGTFGGGQWDSDIAVAYAGEKGRSARGIRSRCAPHCCFCTVECITVAHL